MSLIPMPASRAEWLALRRQRIGASEVGALFGVQAPFQQSAFALHHIKAGAAEEPDISGPRLTWGLKLEEVIATAAAEEKGWTVRRGRYAVCDTCRLGASLDFEIEADPTGKNFGPGVMETKNVDWLQHRRTWTEGEPPPHILMQLQAQLMASGYTWGVVAGLVGGNDLQIYPYTAMPALHAEIKERVDEFWRRVAENDPPPVDGSESASRVLATLYAEPADDVIDLSESNEWPEAVAAFIAATAAKKQAQEDYADSKNRVISLMGAHKRAYGSGYSVSTAITPAKPDRPAAPGEIIKGRAETRRYTAKAQESAA